MKQVVLLKHLERRNSKRFEQVTSHKSDQSQSRHFADCRVFSSQLTGQTKVIDLYIFKIFTRHLYHHFDIYFICYSFVCSCMLIFIGSTILLATHPIGVGTLGIIGAYKHPPHTPLDLHHQPPQHGKRQRSQHHIPTSAALPSIIVT